MKTISLPQLHRLLLLLAFLLPFSALSAQTQPVDDDDEEEEEGDDWTSPVREQPLAKFDEALIMVDGKKFEVTPEISVPRNDTIEIAVTQLKPLSRVGVVVKKGNIVVKKTAFYANEKGELILEVRTGGKLSGNAVVDYIASSGKEVSFDVKVQVE